MTLPTVFNKTKGLLVKLKTLELNNLGQTQAMITQDL